MSDTGDQFKVGDQVILGEHHAGVDSNGNVLEKHWNEHMDQYVGKRATITHVRPTHRGFPFQLYAVDIDKGRWFWRGVNMTLVAKVPVHATKDDGAFCGRCHNFIPYVEPKSGFICYGCRH
jgi:hypothetical protein